MLLVHLLLVLAAMTAGAALFTWYVTRRIEAAFPPVGEWIELEGERIFYRRMGRGPAIVLVHGLAGQSKNFDYLPLQELARRWTLVLLDRPGSGYSPRRDNGKAGIAAQGRLVAAFIRAMRFETPPLLVGHSLGGAIALNVGLEQPDCIAGVGLICPLTHFTPHVPLPFRTLKVQQPWLRKVFAHTWAAPLAVFGTPVVISALFGPDPAPRDFALRGDGIWSLRPACYLGAATDMLAIEGDLKPQQERYATLRLPVHVLFAQGDRALDWRAHGQALVDKVPQAQLTLIPGGHMVPVTAVPQTTAWLEGCARAVHGDLCNSAVQ
jgi:pimeloyl-ACP methyl ester carboxylesterase